MRTPSTPAYQAPANYSEAQAAVLAKVQERLRQGQLWGRQSTLVNQLWPRGDTARATPVLPQAKGGV